MWKGEVVRGERTYGNGLLDGDDQMRVANLSGGQVL